MLYSSIPSLIKSTAIDILLTTLYFTNTIIKYIKYIHLAIGTVVAGTQAGTLDIFKLIFTLLTQAHPVGTEWCGTLAL